jgi:hypothetical protein
MVTEADVRALALSLPQATEHPHFDRAAFKARTIFATLGGGTVNFMLVPEQAAMLLEADPETFVHLGGWTKHGAVGARLDRIDADRLEMLLRDAWRKAAPKGVTID